MDSILFLFKCAWGESTLCRESIQSAVSPIKCCQSHEGVKSRERESCWGSQPKRKVNSVCIVNPMLAVTTPGLSVPLGSQSFRGSGYTIQLPVSRDKASSGSAWFSLNLQERFFSNHAWPELASSLLCTTVSAYYVTHGQALIMQSTHLPSMSPTQLVCTWQHTLLLPHVCAAAFFQLISLLKLMWSGSTKHSAEHSFRFLPPDCATFKQQIFQHFFSWGRDPWG